MPSLRICHVIHNTECGGAETMLLQLLQELHQKHEMSVISLMQCGATGKQIQELGVPLHAMQFSRGRIPRADRLLRLVRQLRRVAPEIVQTWTYHADLCGGVAARMATRAKVLWNVRHGSLNPRQESLNVLRSARLCGMLSRWIPARILINSQQAVEVHVRAGYDPSKLCVIPNGFDVRRFQPDAEAGSNLRGELSVPQHTPLIGMSGRFHPHKGQAAFVQVAKRIARQLPDARFLISGTGCDSANTELQGWIAAAGLRERFHLLGRRDDMPRLLNALDILLLPSSTEGMPNVVGEAMACGIPVVAMDVGDVRRLLGERGRVVPAGGVHEMAQQCLSILAAAGEERHRESDRARQRIVEHFAIHSIAEQYERQWLAVADSPAPLASPSTQRCQHSPTACAPAKPPPDRPRLVHVTTIGLTPWLFLRGQNHYMTARGLDVHVVSSPGVFLDKVAQRDPVTTHAVPISRKIDPLADARSVYQLWRLFRKLRPQIVQLSTPKAALLGAIAAQAAAVPIRIYQVRGLSSESESGLRRRLFQFLERLTAALCNGHLVNAPSLRDYARGAGILQAGLVAGAGMSNGVDLQRFCPGQVKPADLSSWGPDLKGPVIGYLGRLTRDKGLEDLLSAWSTLRKEFPNSRLLVVGPWETENAITSTCRESLLNDPRVLLPGLQEEVAAFYRAMDVFVFPSHGTEGFPNAPMEAAAMQLPVIASRVVGNVDAVEHGVTGTLIAPRAPAALTEALRRYLRDAELRRRHGNAGRARVLAAYRPEALWADFFSYYTFLLRREGLPLPVRQDYPSDLPEAA